jgi:hypothetical protein
VAIQDNGQHDWIVAFVSDPRRCLTIACSGQVFGAALICAGQGLMFEARNRGGGPRGVTCR